MRVSALRVFLGVAVAAGISAVPAAAQDYRFSVINGTNVPIEYFYYSSCSANDWLSDRLGSNEVIRPGSNKVFDMYDGIRDCCRDMRAKFTNGVTREQMGINVCRAAEWVVR